MPRFQQNEEDLFKDSTMTFVEHLDELRKCLFKAVVGLALGFLVGLAMGGVVVNIIQTPLRNALIKYYERSSVEKGQKRLAELRDSGVQVPANSKQFENLVVKHHLLAEDVWISPDEVLQQLADKYPQQFKGVQLPSAGPDDQFLKDRLIHAFLWRSTGDDPRVRTKSFSSQEAFSIYIKAAVLVGALLSSPWVFYQIWSFVAAGLYPHEKRYIHVFLPFSVLLFLGGASLAFFFVFEPVLNFLLGFNQWLGIDPDPRISEWLGFVLMLPLGFGAAFQLPLVMLFLERIGVFTVKAYLSGWRVSVLGIFILALILTPSGDPYSMMLMVLPLTVLYFGGILLSRYMPRSRSAYDLQKT